MSFAAPLPNRVHLVCDVCQRRGSYSRARYIELTGATNGVEALIAFRRNVAKCPRELLTDPRIEDRCQLLHDLEAEGRPYMPKP